MYSGHIFYSDFCLNVEGYKLSAKTNKFVSLQMYGC